MPADIALFVMGVLALFAVGIPLIRSTVSMPAEVEIEDLGSTAFEGKLGDLLRDTDARLADLGYHPGRTFRVTNMPSSNLVRTYHSRDRWPIVNLNALRNQTGEDTSMRYLEVVSEFADGSLVITRNGDVGDVMTMPPEVTVDVATGVDDPARLLDRHDRTAERFLDRGRVELRPDIAFDRFRSFHRRWVEVQLERGLLRRSPDGETLQATTRAALRGIRNYLNPFADDFTWRRALLAVIVGTGFPIAALAGLNGPGAGLVDRLVELSGLDRRLVVALLLSIPLTLSGAIAGLLFRGKTFLWTFLLAYLPLRLLGPAGLAPLGLSLWSGWVAARVARLRDRNVRVLDG